MRRKLFWAGGALVVLAFTGGCGVTPTAEVVNSSTDETVTEGELWVGVGELVQLRIDGNSADGQWDWYLATESDRSAQHGRWYANTFNYPGDYELIVRGVWHEQSVGPFHVYIHVGGERPDNGGQTDQPFEIVDNGLTITGGGTIGGGGSIIITNLATCRIDATGFVHGGRGPYTFVWLNESGTELGRGPVFDCSGLTGSQNLTLRIIDARGRVITRVIVIVISPAPSILHLTGVTLSPPAGANYVVGEWVTATITHTGSGTIKVWWADSRSILSYPSTGTGVLTITHQWTHVVSIAGTFPARSLFWPDDRDDPPDLIGKVAEVK